MLGNHSQIGRRRRQQGVDYSWQFTLFCMLWKLLLDTLLCKDILDRLCFDLTNRLLLFSP